MGRFRSPRGVRRLMIAVAVVAFAFASPLSSMLGRWALGLRHEHKMVGIHKDSFTTATGQVIHGGSIHVFDDGCLVALK